MLNSSVFFFLVFIAIYHHLVNTNNNKQRQIAAIKLNESIKVLNKMKDTMVGNHCEMCNTKYLLFQQYNKKYFCYI